MHKLKIYLLVLFKCTSGYYLKQAEADWAMGRSSVAPKYLNRVVFWGQRTVSSTERRVFIIWTPSSDWGKQNYL